MGVLHSTEVAILAFVLSCTGVNSKPLQFFLEEILMLVSCAAGNRKSRQEWFIKCKL